MEKFVIGILAHVDAGKTTLSEAILYESKTIRKMGRVDKQDAFLDTFELEKNRGITIFSKQAIFKLNDKIYTLLDTPGHIDFQAEMERTLQVLDYGVLVISSTDCIQAHTYTVWKLLKQYNIPTFIFVNKMDQYEGNKEDIISEIKNKLDIGCVDFSDLNSKDFYESVATCNEKVLDYYMENGIVTNIQISEMINNRELFPCFFGSALKMIGVKELLVALEKYSVFKENNQFGGRVFKISRDNLGNRLTHIKITSGKLKVKTILCDEEKINQIRIYSGEKYTTENEVLQGTVCTLTGLSKTYSGQCVGSLIGDFKPVLEPVLSYVIKLPEGVDANKTLKDFMQLEDEDPLLSIRWNDKTKEIMASLMGEIQIEILKSLIKDRFDLDVEFINGKIIYKETIEEPCYGIGHFEPLRHYAEVHLLLEPLERGSGLLFETKCSEDVLAKNWQKLVVSHLQERMHPGVLTGSDITDMKITLVTGKAHQKHTEGGDFRQATYRALRNGLRLGKNVLLEPYYEFSLTLKKEYLGKALNDMDNMFAKINPIETYLDESIITGICPVYTMRDYQRSVTSYTRGTANLTTKFFGYDKCHNEEEVVFGMCYEPEGDLDNPTGSVFCSHGCGFNVPFNEVYDYKHLEMPDSAASKLKRIQNEHSLEKKVSSMEINRENFKINENKIDYKELDEIFARTYKNVKQDRTKYVKATTSFEENIVISKSKPKPVLPKYLLVDGYNIIFAWDELSSLAKLNLDAARNKLLDILCNYQGMKKCNLIAVFDAYKLKGFKGEVSDFHNIKVVFTKEAQTADAYIEKTAHEIGHKYDVTVATSDGLEQMIIRGAGCNLMSARDFKDEIDNMNKVIKDEIKNITKQADKNWNNGINIKTE